MARGMCLFVMALSIFNSLSLGPLQSTDVVIHLANKSVAYPVGFIEDVLVCVSLVNCFNWRICYPPLHLIRKMRSIGKVLLVI